MLNQFARRHTAARFQDTERADGHNSLWTQRNNDTFIDFSTRMMSLVNFSTKPTTKALLTSFTRALAIENIPAAAAGTGDKINGADFNEGELPHLALELWSAPALATSAILVSFAGTQHLAELKNVCLVPFSPADSILVNRILGQPPATTMRDQFAAESSPPATRAAEHQDPNDEHPNDPDDEDETPRPAHPGSLAPRNHPAHRRSPDPSRNKLRRPRQQLRNPQRLQQACGTFPLPPTRLGPTSPRRPRPSPTCRKFPTPSAP
jgi:hypothetical protein